MAEVLKRSVQWTAAGGPPHGVHADAEDKLRTSGACIIELVEISDEHAVLSDEDDWVLIEKVGNKFIANGSPGGRMIATFFKPDPFDSAEEAIKICTAWAEANGVARVYVKAEA